MTKKPTKKRLHRKKNAPPRRPRAGQPTVLTPQVRARCIVEASKGNYIDVVAQLAGIARSTLTRALHLGRDALENAAAEGREATGDYARFARDYDQAVAESESGSLEKIAVAGRLPNNWTAEAWRLERRFPMRWAQRKREDGDVDKLVRQLGRQILINVQLVLRRYLAPTAARDALIELGRMTDESFALMPELQPPDEEPRAREDDPHERRGL